MAFGNTASSSLYPLPSSHAHPIRRPYQVPTFDNLDDNTSNSIANGRSSASSLRSSKNGSSPSPAPSSGAGSEAGELGLQKMTLSNAPRRASSASSGSGSRSPQSNGKNGMPEAFFPVSYIRGEWMQKLLELDLGKRKVRFYLSDEVLCLGTDSAPIMSEFHSGLTFYEAYRHTNGEEGSPEHASVYMSEGQVTWLVDELYSSLGTKNKKLKFEQVDVDKNMRIQLKEFKAIRKISFKNNVASFRRRCGIPMMNIALMKEKEKERKEIRNQLSFTQNWKQAPPKGDISIQANGTNSHGALSSTAHNGILPPASIPPSLDTGSNPAQSIGLPSPTDLPVASQATPIAESSTSASTISSAPKAFTSLTRAERQARLQAQRAEALRLHLVEQRAALPMNRQLYRNLERYGGAALACDVESWTEDAEVLLELGLAWFVWEPRDAGVTERDGGSSHYIIEETIQYKNEEIEATRWDYSLGTSQTLPQNDVSRALRAKIEELSKHGPLILVFHDASAETRYFQKLGIDPTSYHLTAPSELTWPKPRWPTLPSASSPDYEPIIIIQDTQNLYAGWSEPQIKQINLGKACLTFGLVAEATKLHNAGNDAFATLRVWELLLEMELNETQKKDDPPAGDHLNQIESSESRPVQTMPRLQSETQTLQACSEESRGRQAVVEVTQEVNLIELW